MRLTIRRAGFCRHPEITVWPGASPKPARFPALYFELEHPTRGVILVDTGYAPRFLDETQKLPFWVLGKIAPAEIPEHESAVHHVDPALIVITHFHADHVAGLKDFPKARFLCLPQAWEAVRGLRGHRALHAGFVPALVPRDFALRLDAPRGMRGEHYDLLGDGSLLGTDLPGHAPGQMGLRFETAEGPVLLCSDACWLSRAYREMRLPSPWGMAVQDDQKAYRRSLERLHSLYRSEDIRIIPSHCREWEPA